MPGVTPFNSRESLPKGMQYPLRYSDVEAAFKPFAEHELFVRTWFWRCASRVVRTEDKLGNEYSLVSVRYHPTISEWEVGPWDDIDTSVLVSVDINAIPTLLAKEVTPQRDVLRKLLCDFVRPLMEESMNERPYELTLSLRLDPARIQISERMGTRGEAGLRERSVEKLLAELNRSIGLGRNNGTQDNQ